MKRSENYTRRFKVGGVTRYFDFFQAFDGPDAKEKAQETARKLQTGEIPGLYGYQGPHWVRVVSMNWYTDFDHKYSGLLARYAVYCFPKEG